MAFCATPPTLKQSLATCKHLVAIAAPQDSETSSAILQRLRSLSSLGYTDLTIIDPFAEADEDTGETKQSQNYIHIRIQRKSHPIPCLKGYHGTMLTLCPLERNGRKTLTTVQGLPKKFDQKKILKVIKKKFGKSPLQLVKLTMVLTITHIACNGTIVNDTEMGEVIQLQGDQRKDVQEFLVDKKEGLELDAKTIKVGHQHVQNLRLRLTHSLQVHGF